MSNKHRDISNEVKPSKLAEAFDKDIRPLIDLIDELRRDGLEQDVSLPSVVVVGDQSSGKSSILEAISGVQLPRGTGIVTRCPLEMQLKREHNWKAHLTYKATSNTVAGNVEIANPASVESAISNAQNALAGTSTGISPFLITLRIESPSVPDLTLIDLPGIARTAVEGQPADIGKQIRELIKEYIKKENVIILCVIAANLDIAVNEAISLAHKADPDGSRTLGVITKPDLVEECSKQGVLDLLDNRRVKLEKGFNIVKLRNIEQLNAKLSLQDALQAEKKYFTTDKIYKTGNVRKMGVENLSQRLTEQLVQLITNTFPEMKEKIEDMHAKQSTILELMKPGPPAEIQSKHGYLYKIMSEFNYRIERCIREGEMKKDGRTGTWTDKNIYCAWRQIFKDFENTIGRKIKENMDSRTSPLSVANISKKITNARGRELPHFMNYDLFETLVREQVLCFKEPALECLKQLSNNIKDLTQEIVKEYFSNLPELKADMLEICHQITQKLKGKSRKRINQCFEEELLVYTQDTHFIHQMNDLEEELRETYARDPNLKEVHDGRTTDEVIADKMHDLIKRYLKISKSRIADRIPCSLRLCLHIEFAKELKNRTEKYISMETTISKVIEPPDVAEHRERLQGQVKRLDAAMQKLSRFSALCE